MLLEGCCTFSPAGERSVALPLAHTVLNLERSRARGHAARYVVGMDSRHFDPDDVAGMLVFAAVAERGSFTAAAEALGLAKSVVSAKVARLEQRLGVRLLHRTSRRVALTPAGTEVYPACARVARAARDAQEVAAGESAAPHGRLRVNAPVTFGQRWLGAPIAAFAELYPAVHVDVVLQDDAVDVVGGGWDVVVRLGADHQQRRHLAHQPRGGRRRRGGDPVVRRRRVGAGRSLGTCAPRGRDERSSLPSGARARSPAAYQGARVRRAPRDVVQGPALGQPASALNPREQPLQRQSPAPNAGWEQPENIANHPLTL